MFAQWCFSVVVTGWNRSGNRGMFLFAMVIGEAVMAILAEQGREALSFNCVLFQGSYMVFFPIGWCPAVLAR